MKGEGGCGVGGAGAMYCLFELSMDVEHKDVCCRSALCLSRVAVYMVVHKTASVHYTEWF